jgi:hypothetical protein
MKKRLTKEELELTKAKPEPFRFIFLLLLLIRPYRRRPAVNLHLNKPSCVDAFVDVPRAAGQCDAIKDVKNAVE